MEHIVFLERDSIRAHVRRPDFPYTWREYPLTKPEEILERVNDATIATTNKVMLRGDLLGQLPTIKLIA